MLQCFEKFREEKLSCIGGGWGHHGFFDFLGVTVPKIFGGGTLVFQKCSGMEKKLHG